jgi:predicted ATPase
MGATEMAEEDVLDCLSRLVDKSLVVVDLDRSRYAMLETVREYALGRLEEAGETEAARARHLEFHVRLGREARVPLQWAGRSGYLRSL